MDSQGTGRGATTPQYAWVILVVAYLTTVSASLVMNKVSPIMPALMDAFELNLSQAGLLTAVIGLTALFLTLPAGMMIQKLGLKTTGVIGFLLLGLGIVLGAVSPGFGTLISSRVLEGIGAAILVIVSPTAISMWFPFEMNGVSMGIWSTAIPMGGVIAFFGAPALEAGSGWSGVWWATGVVAVIALPAFWLLVRPAPIADDAALSSDAGIKGDWTNKTVWLAGLGAMFFGFSFFPIITYYPTFLNAELGMALAQAGAMVGIIGLVTLAGAPLAGWLSDRLGTRKWVIVAGFLLFAPLLALVFQLSQAMIVPAMLLLGLCPSAIQTALFTAAPEAVQGHKAAAMSLAVVTASLNLSMVIGPPLFGSLADSLGWAAAGYVFVAAPVLGAIAVGLNKNLR